MIPSSGVSGGLLYAANCRQPMNTKLALCFDVVTAPAARLIALISVVAASLELQTACMHGHS
jgi:type IV secretory pathway VirB2 component (pilin)